MSAIEEWFVARGVPHFVERRPSAWEIWGRAIPLLVVAYLLLGLNALDLAEWTWLGNLLAALFVVAVLVLTWIGANMIGAAAAAAARHDRPRRARCSSSSRRSHPPCSASGAMSSRPCVEGAVVLLAVWALTSYGVLPLLAWAGRRTWSQLPAYLNLIVRAYRCCCCS